jgi:hypothetical protein
MLKARPQGWQVEGDIRTSGIGRANGEMNFPFWPTSADPGAVMVRIPRVGRVRQFSLPRRAAVCRV